MMTAFAVTLSDARPQLEAFIEDYRVAVDATLDDLSEDQCRRQLVPSATTLLGIVKHVTWMQRIWFEECVGNMSRSDLGLAPTADASFALEAHDSVDSVRTAYREACATGRRVVAGVPLDAVVTGHHTGPRTLHWVYLQVLRELAHHCGHADILREQILSASPIAPRSTSPGPSV